MSTRSLLEIIASILSAPFDFYHRQHEERKIRVDLGQRIIAVFIEEGDETGERFGFDWAGTLEHEDESVWQIAWFGNRYFLGTQSRCSGNDNQ